MTITNDFAKLIISCVAGLRKQLHKGLGQPEEVAKAVAFLAIDATYTTGAELTVDGGWSQI